jgi:hypothetical protein
MALAMGFDGLTAPSRIAAVVIVNSGAERDAYGKRALERPRSMTRLCETYRDQKVQRRRTVPFSRSSTPTNPVDQVDLPDVKCLVQAS